MEPMIAEHDLIVLTSDIPAESLVAGDVGTVVHLYSDGKAYEVEFTTISGETISVATVEAANLRPVGPGDISHARESELAAA